MAFQSYLRLVLLYSFANIIASTPSHYHNHAVLNRSSFPPGFIFGTASSSYQYEGAAKDGGRGPSIWDTFTHRCPFSIRENQLSGQQAFKSMERRGGTRSDSSFGTFPNWCHKDRIQDGSNGDVTVDQYHRYKEDVGIMRQMGLDAYRFSISWSRVLPNGRLSGGVNMEGIKYYNNLINELLAKGLKPFVTLFHFDLPQSLEDDYGGFLSPHIVNDFRDYTEVCFKEFGDRVKHWITLNEPTSYSVGGYASGAIPPGRCSDWQNQYCTKGNSGTEPYLVIHHQLHAHAAAVKAYRQKYQKRQKGTIGISLETGWIVPYSKARHDRNAMLRALDFRIGWLMDPLINGDYPHSMRSLPMHLNIMLEMQATLRILVLIFQLQAASEWLHLYPRGIRDLLLYIKQKYHNPLIYITENGIDEFNNATLSLEEALVDNQRIEYYCSHLWYLQKAIRDGVNVKGYFAWSLLDNFEWNSGYTVRFGINYVDYKDGCKRHPKLSAHWFTNFLKK
ncbi:beta-glucosidase 11-like isoform X3 [Juglans microcarpa x Juglans regia]|uniref:beta-glucosidase 11-like isoform X3 n=1 Tax=Juglans microcarpa x Juglans regia TaxID=2249226 RepID=UPI001B7EFD7A|nr:beta-glucosidase 11-like isoform X3 [Juglans microcarpa x Juglans regia]